MKSEWPEPKGSGSQGRSMKKGGAEGSTHGCSGTSCANKGHGQLRGPACSTGQSTSSVASGPGGGTLGSAGPVRPPDLWDLHPTPEAHSLLVPLLTLLCPLFPLPLKPGANASRQV